MNMIDNALTMSNSTCLPVLIFSSENKLEMIILLVYIKINIYKLKIFLNLKVNLAVKSSYFT